MSRQKPSRKLFFVELTPVYMQEGKPRCGEKYWYSMKRVHISAEHGCIDDAGNCAGYIQASLLVGWNLDVSALTK